MDVSCSQRTFVFRTITVNTYYNMCIIFNSCSMSPHLMWVGYTNLVSNKSVTGTWNRAKLGIEDSFRFNILTSISRFECTS